MNQDHKEKGKEREMMIHVCLTQRSAPSYSISHQTTDRVLLHMAIRRKGVEVVDVEVNVFV